MAELNRRVESIKSELTIGTKKPHRSCICAALFALSLSNTPNQQCWCVRLASVGMNFLQFVKRLGFRSHWATVSPPSTLLHRPALALHGLEHAYHRATHILCCPIQVWCFFHESIWERARRKCLERSGQFKNNLEADLPVLTGHNEGFEWDETAPRPVLEWF